MIKFFKKIRQNLLSEGKTGKPAWPAGRYLKYAFGEIILVMLGILFALQVNNWNENRKEEILEIEYLQRIHTDLTADANYFKKEIQECELVISSSYQYIHEAYKEQKTKEDYVKLIGYFTDRTENLVVQNSTYQELNNSGQLSIFQNRAIKDSLIALQRNYEYAAARIKEFNDYHANVLSTLKVYPRKYSRSRAFIFDEPYMFNRSDWEYINDPASQAFKDQEWAATIYLLKHSEAMEFHKKLLTKVEFMIELVENELDRRK
jgi:hypothetical protein